MVGIGLKKLAQQNGMQLDSGVAYGSLRGYATTLFEGIGWKRINIGTKIADPVQLTQLETEVNSVDVQKEYGVKELLFGIEFISAIFTDNFGTIEKLEKFIDWFYPLLDKYGATKANICAECGGEVIVGSWYLVGSGAYYFHENCAQNVSATVAEADRQRKEKDKGSYIQGLVGAFAGAVLGAVVWALVLKIGFVATVVGFVIGWLAEKGYTLLHGKQGKAKVLILILSVIFGVVLGTLAADGITLVQMINAGELPGFTYGEIPSWIFRIFKESAEYRNATISNVGLGLLFAALGVFSLLRKAGIEVADTKVKKLN